MNLHQKSIAALIVFFLALMAGQGAFARAMKADNSYVVLDLPDSFKPQSRFAGFFSKDAGATIMVLDLPLAAYSQFTNQFDKELEKKGYSEVRHGKLEERHDEHLFFFARQHTPVGQFDKYLLIFKNDKRAAYVTITVNPIEKVETPLSYIGAKNILTRLTLDDHPAARRKTYLLSYMGAFRESKVIAGSTTIFNLKKPDEKAGANAKNGKTMFVIAPSLSQHKVKDIGATGRALMKKFSKFRDMKLNAEEEITVDGMNAYGLSGTAINKSNSQPVGVYQLVVANPNGGYFRIVGVAANKNFSHYLLEFRRMAASFKRVQQ